MNFIALVSRLPEALINNQDAVGRCTHVGTDNSGGSIYLQLEAWLRYTENQRLVLLSHELAHCTLGKTHDVNNLIMQPSVPEPNQIANINTVSPTSGNLVWVDLLGCH